MSNSPEHPPFHVLPPRINHNGWVERFCSPVPHFFEEITQFVGFPVSAWNLVKIDYEIRSFGFCHNFLLVLEILWYTDALVHWTEFSFSAKAFWGNKIINKLGNNRCIDHSLADLLGTTSLALTAILIIRFTTDIFLSHDYPPVGKKMKIVIKKNANNIAGI